MITDESIERHGQPESDILAWLVAWVAHEIGLPPEEIDVTAEFVNLGLDSRQGVKLSADLEHKLNCTLSPSIAWEFTTLQDLADHLRALQ
jgi:acyl carrier protein